MLEQEVTQEDTKKDNTKQDTQETKKKEWKQINETKAIWKKSKSEITQEEHKQFYQSLSMDYNEPFGKIHTSIEGAVSYKALLYIPQQTNMFADMRDPNRDYGPKLYIQNVLILEHAKELLPVWLRFVSGVVETSDLPLNISREMLQNNKALDTIKKSLIKKVLAELKKLRQNDTEKYHQFFSHYGSILKEGVYYEHALKENIAEVLEFSSLLQENKISLDEYLESCKTSQSQDKKTQSSSQDTSDEKSAEDSDKAQKTIYYITGKNQSEVLASPYLEQFRSNKVNVLFLTDPVDEWMM